MTLNKFHADSATTELLDLLKKISDAAYRQMDQTRMMDVCLAGLCHHFARQGAALMVRDYEKSWMLCMRFNQRISDAELRKLQTRIRTDYTRRSGEQISESACTLQVQHPADPGAPAAEQIHWQSIPLEIDGNLLGLLSLDLPGENPPPALRTILHHLCTALASSQNMRQLLITDPMTGCYNRWFMDIELSKFCMNLHQHTPAFAVMLVDVDQFKQINDGYGHAAGDQCLVMLADFLREGLDGNDAVIRMGGDEFLIWIPALAGRELSGLGEELRNRVADQMRLPEAPDMTITLSIGMVAHHPHGGYISKEDLLDRADQALYRAKREGRNRAVHWQADLDAGAGEDTLAPRIPEALLQQLETQARQLETDPEQLMDILEAVLNAKQYETGLHSLRVTRITRYLLSQLDLPEAEKVQILRGARLHDIGKIAIPDRILNKQGKLSEPEWALMRQHPVIGHRFICGFPFLKTAGELVLYHHEAFDGSGYPRGLTGEQIPYHTRLFSLVDSYDSMRANRSYQPFVPRDAAIAELEKHRGTQFDPAWVDFFLSHIEAIEEIGHWEG